MTDAVTQLHDSGPERVADRIVESTRRALGKGRAFFYRETSGVPFPIATDNGDLSPFDQVSFRDHGVSQDFVPVVLRSNRPLIVRDTARLRPSPRSKVSIPRGPHLTQTAASREPGSLIAVIVRTPDGARGVLTVESDAANEFNADDLKLLEHVSEPSAVTLAHANQFQELQRRALYDCLTGLLRRDAFDRRFRIDIQRAIRYDHCASLLVLDIDHFKSVNDNFGHPAGDQILIRVAEIMRESAPAGAQIGRIGGEEFAVSFISDNPSEAGAVADRIRSTIAAGISRPDGSPLTISIGVAICPLHSDNAPALMKAADTAMYKAKTTGRNRVESAITHRFERTVVS